MEDIEVKDKDIEVNLNEGLFDTPNEDVQKSDDVNEEIKDYPEDSNVDSFDNPFDDIGEDDDGQTNEQPDNDDETSEESYKVLGEAAFILHKNALPFIADKILRLIGKKINYQLFDLITKEEKKTLVSSYNILIKHYLKTAPSPVSAAWYSIASVTISQVLLSMEDDKKDKTVTDSPNSEESNSYKESFIRTRKRGRPRKNK